MPAWYSGVGSYLKLVYNLLQSQNIDGLSEQLDTWTAVTKDELHGRQAFRYGAYRHMVLEPIREYISAKGYTNVEFINYGSVLENNPL
jgi:hypothetical protein